MMRLPLIDINLIELSYFPFMVSLDKCHENCNVVDDLSRKIYDLSQTKHLTLKLFNIITRINEANTLVKHFSCGFKL